ncbi:uncharacterized protein LY79DRAFT_124440 [Colletotrichum navitas]|uniref:Uncharacterized protein n=1 Tax=Colletotrichum navitas TaxID=681940 RepID=A0AAD8V7J3_9PEZI|nr:uncharacterized protein LY79DRAFT_124440 [Colletotrichum navitas]KAK1594756.1 hypothetical protein LY79DRAFT_124440 [Colletotrichum navitas]
MNSYRALVFRVRDGTRYMGYLSLSPEYHTLNHTHTHTHTCARARAKPNTLSSSVRTDDEEAPSSYFPPSMCKEHAVRSLSVLPDPGRQIRQRTRTRTQHIHASIPEIPDDSRPHSGSSELLPVPPPPASKQDESFVRGFPPTLTLFIVTAIHPSIV